MVIEFLFARRTQTGDGGKNHTATHTSGGFQAKVSQKCESHEISHWSNAMRIEIFRGGRSAPSFSRTKFSGKTLAQMNYSRCRITVKFYGLDDVNNIWLTLSVALKTHPLCDGRRSCVRLYFLRSNNNDSLKSATQPKSYCSIYVRIVRLRAYDSGRALNAIPKCANSSGFVELLPTITGNIVHRIRGKSLLIASASKISHLLTRCRHTASDLCKLI